ncbi:alpha/beta hydrolase [Verticiella sediminum]|uniref:Alpha/beta hydrolase n=1 Tax=Verticiella sediminum TaxID=1247510 RepID=A0A556ABW4_9BURK|nr:alpha/beta hydrolase [Verticiella sediminum]TSH90386.1 alpha/beta hydrolase [Verticiella sediminum]
MSTDYPLLAGRYAEVAPGVKLHYRACGPQDGRLLIFLHGFPEAGFIWEPHLQAMAGEWLAVAPDLRGYNLSSKPAEVAAYRPDALVGDLIGLIRHFGRERATIVAHDWGGALAWNLAILHPGYVERLVIVNSPHPVLFARALASDPAQQAASAYMNWLRQPGSEEALVADDFRRLDGMLAGHGQNGAWYTEAERARYHAMWSVPGEGGSHAMTGAVNYYRASPLRPPSANDPAPPPQLDPTRWRTGVPVRVIWATDDLALPASLADGLPEVCADLRVWRIADAGHWVVHERPDAFQGLLKAALQDMG